MKIEFIDRMLYINGVKIHNNVTLTDVENIADIDWELWNYGNMEGRRKIFNLGGEDIVIIIYFERLSYFIVSWKLTPYELIRKKNMLRLWAKKIFNINIPYKISEENIEVFNQYDPHSDYYSIDGTFDRWFDHNLFK